MIIPARDEEAQIGTTLGHAQSGSPAEIIVVDGGSRDRTADVARAHGVKVIAAPRGRGIQMNAGAAVATGDTLLFLHADTRLPQGWSRHVSDILHRAEVSAGAFELHVDAERWSLRFVERVVRWRSRLLQMPYGDQALFMTRDTFDRVGGFPTIPVMEDFEMVRRLRRLGRVAIAPAAVSTSARRWLARGVARTTLLNQLCIAAYCLGVSPQRIARLRRRALSPSTASATDDAIETTARPARGEQSV